MRGALLDLHSIVAEAPLRAALERALAEHFARPVGIVTLERRVSQYCSSYLLEELDLTLTDGTRLELIFKDLSKAALILEAESIKPRFIYDPLREIHTYRGVLASHSFGAPIYYGAFIDPDHSRYWLFLERVPPGLLWQVGEFEVWEKTAAWLAGMHTLFAPDAHGGQPSWAHLIAYDREFYQRWMDRAAAFVTLGDPAPNGAASQSIRWLASRYKKVVNRLLSLPVTVIHGEFYASNVLLDQGPEGLRVCPVDWEMAAVGPGLVDLAGLVSGGWTPAQKTAMARAYYRALPEDIQVWRDEPTFLEDLEFCRLHQSVQWLGWSPGWKPPEEHAQNWLKEAIRCAENLGL